MVSDNQDFLQAGYDVIVISPPGAIQAIIMTNSERASMTY